MTQLDQFTSRFQRAAKETFHIERPAVERVLFITDLDASGSELRLEGLQRFLKVLSARNPELSWTTIDGGHYRGVHELMAKVAEAAPSLVVTYRALKEPDRELVYSLGTCLDVLAQVATMPVLVLPNPGEGGAELPEGTPSVGVITDHMTGNDALINWALALLEDPGDLILTHVEADNLFEKYIGVIGKIPEIDTDLAREKIREQLLKEPREFMDSVLAALQRAGSEVEVTPEVRLGHLVSEYKDLVADHEVELLVFDAKDASQSAMAGVAYSLAVELTELPLLLL